MKSGRTTENVDATVEVSNKTRISKRAQDVMRTRNVGSKRVVTDICPHYSTRFMVFAVHFVVVFINCCLVVVATQKYFGENVLVVFLRWLQAMDGVEINMNRHVPRKPEVIHMLKNISVPIMGIANWCFVHCVECLALTFACHGLLFLLARRKWFSLASLNCILTLTLLLKASKQKTYYSSSFLDAILLGVTCILSWYQLLTLSVPTKTLFGCIKEKKKTNKVLELKPSTDEENQEVTREYTTNGRALATRLKLPEELAFAEENHNLDQNIGCLSLGPKDCGKDRKAVKGSWFDNNLASRSLKPTDQLGPDKQSLIWPAKFQLNGVSDPRQRKRNDVMSEFSDNELAGPDTLKGLKKSQRKFRSKTDKDAVSQRKRLSKHWNCNVYFVVLFLSLALNAWFLWLLKGTITKTVFKT